MNYSIYREKDRENEFFIKYKYYRIFPNGNKQWIRTELVKKNPQLYLGKF